MKVIGSTPYAHHAIIGLPLALAVALLSGCGSNDAGSPAAQAAEATAATTPTVTASSLGTGPAGPGTLPLPSVDIKASATKSVVIRPVNRAGRPAPGYTVTDETATTIDCTSKRSSPAAVDADIMQCDPRAAYAAACWKAAAPARALCLRDPSSRKLAEVSTTTSRLTGTAAPDHPRPLGLTLSDGVHCSIAIGGGFPPPPAPHSTWSFYYRCGSNGVIWGPSDGRTADGIDRSTSRWTVQVAAGEGPLRVRHVITAYFVGTRRS